MAKEKMSLADQVFENIKVDILSGTLTTGSKVSEEELVAKYNVSRTPVREALRKMSDYGLITIVPRSHAEITTITPKDAKDIADLRITLELYALNNLTSKSFSDQLDEMARNAATCQYYLSIGQRGKCFESDSLFHLALINAANNSVLSSMYTKFDAKIQLLRVKQNETDSRLGDYIAQHIEIINLLKNGEIEKAKEILADHVKHSLS